MLVSSNSREQFGAMGAGAAVGIGFRQLEVFRAVAETRSFTRACHALFITQSTVSQHVHELETELKVKLFDRNRRNVALTPAGENLLQYSKHIFSILDEAESAVRTAHNPYSGKLSLGCASSTLLYHLPPLLTEYARRYPNVQLKIFGGTIRDVVAQLSSDALDLAVVVLPVSMAEVRKVHLWDEGFVLVLPKHHRLARRRTLKIEELSKEQFILHGRSQNTRKIVDRYLFRHAVSPQVPIEIADTETIKAMVAHNLGVSLLPESAFVQRRATPGLKIFPIPQSELSRSLAIIYPRARPLRPPALAMVEALQSRFQGQRETESKPNE
jgi:DNA-binding transcriptional LysR family regulator